MTTGELHGGETHRSFETRPSTFEHAHHGFCKSVHPYAIEPWLTGLPVSSKSRFYLRDGFRSDDPDGRSRLSRAWQTSFYEYQGSRSGSRHMQDHPEETHGRGAAETKLYRLIVERRTKASGYRHRGEKVLISHRPELLGTPQRDGGPETIGFPLSGRSGRAAEKMRSAQRRPQAAGEFRARCKVARAPNLSSKRTSFEPDWRDHGLLGCSLTSRSKAAGKSARSICDSRRARVHLEIYPLPTCQAWSETWWTGNPLPRTLRQRYVRHAGYTRQKALEGGTCSGLHE